MISQRNRTCCSDCEDQGARERGWNLYWWHAESMHTAGGLFGIGRGSATAHASMLVRRNVGGEEWWSSRSSWRAPWCRNGKVPIAITKDSSGMWTALSRTDWSRRRGAAAASVTWDRWDLFRSLTVSVLASSGLPLDWPVAAMRWASCSTLVYVPRSSLSNHKQFIFLLWFVCNFYVISYPVDEFYLARAWIEAQSVNLK